LCAQGFVRICERHNIPVQLAKFDGFGHNNLRDNYEDYAFVLYQFLVSYLEVVLLPTACECFVREARSKRKTQQAIDIGCPEWRMRMAFNHATGRVAQQWPDDIDDDLDFDLPSTTCPLATPTANLGDNVCDSTCTTTSTSEPYDLHNPYRNTVQDQANQVVTATVHPSATVHLCL
jgi:hypothetical protein